MERELAEQFNREVETYRKALLFYARKCDWEEFKAKAGRLFDYVESIEFSELERRFFHAFTLLLAVLGLAVIALFSMDVTLYPGLLLRLKNTLVLAALGASSFELYFYINYRMYVGQRRLYSKKRREKFIREIEQDFQAYAVQAERKAA